MHYELYKQQEDVLSEHPLAIYTVVYLFKPK